MIRHSLAIASVATMLLAGCASYSGIAPEVKSLEATSLKGSDLAAIQIAWPKEDWWQSLQDPVLSNLIVQALADSPSLQTAMARLRRAQASRDMTESSLSPQVDFNVSSTRERFSEYGVMPPPYAGTTQNMNDLQIGAQWELDFFGKNRETLKAALGELRATEVENQAARMLLATDVARSYYNLARLLAQREVTGQRGRQRGELASLAERRYQAGLDTRVEVESAQGAIPDNARDMAAIEEQISLARHTLAALVGQGPAAMAGLQPTLPAVGPLALPAALPADLLGHRADVTAARWRVESATHDMSAVRAMFYPNVNLRGFVGLSAIGAGKWLDAGSRQPGIGLALSLPLFDAGRLRSNYRISAATVDSAVAAYNATLVDALRDVADQLTSLQSVENQLAHQQTALKSAERSHELALQRYRAGISDRLTELNAESNLIAQRRTAVELQGRWIDGRIHLIRALGGGFGEPPLATPALAEQPPAHANNN